MGITMTGGMPFKLVYGHVDIELFVGETFLYTSGGRVLEIARISNSHQCLPVGSSDPEK